MDLKKKIGPLPVWAWGVIFGVAAYFLYERYQSSSATSSSATNGTTGILDPNAVDPNTGLTYGEEEADALNSNAAAAGSAGGGGDVVPPDSTTGTTGTTGLDLNDFLTDLGALTGSGWIYAPNGSTTGNTANSSPPVQGSSPPTGLPSSHTSSQIETHPGGPFYNWYVQVYGKAPSQMVNTNSTAYTLWKNGVKATVAKATVGIGKATAAAKSAGTGATNKAASTVQNAKPKGKTKPPKGIKVKGP